jgi:hypothetical protein
MKALNLMLHCGGRLATLDAVSDTPTPAAEGIWRPIPHIEVHNSVTRSAERLGLTVVAQTHALGRGGAHYFGLYQLAGENPEMGLVLGTRNSHNKEFLAGIAAGEGVFACDNLAFWAEVVLGRKHTTNIMRDLPGLCDKAVGMLAEKWTSAVQRVDTYKRHTLTDEQVHDFAVRAIDAEVIPARALPTVVREWRTPAHAEFTSNGRSAWRLYNAFTEAFKDIGNPATLARRSQVLNAMMNTTCGIMGTPAAN